MARSDEQEVLRLWQGLGYYSRARNLHQTARYVTTQLNGKFPDNYHDLLKMSGIGTYTAAAIASFAFGERVSVVDGNVYRVLARVFGINEDITTTRAKKTFALLAMRLILMVDDPAVYNQAIMEFGAIQCTPISPDCLLCPLQQQCQAYLTGRQHQLPVKARKAPVRERFFVYLVFRWGNKLALRERIGRDIWQNLHDFYLLEADSTGFLSATANGLEAFLEQSPFPEPLREVVKQGVLNQLMVETTQLLSHQRIHAHFFLVDVPELLVDSLPSELHWYTAEEINQLPKPALIANYLQNLLV